MASRLARDLKGIAGVVDSHVYQVPDAPALTVDVDRAQAWNSVWVSRALPAIW